eukprot:gene16400-22605_t
MELPDREASTGYKAPRTNLQLSDFNITGRVGDGSFSTVILAQHKDSGKQYAIKIVNKHLILRNKTVEYIKNERNILDQLDYEGVVKLAFTFQDPDSLYFGLEFCPGGDLYDQIRKREGVPVEAAKFYAAEIVLMLQYLRSKEIIHRDLKPENFLIAENGHLKLIDFGCAKAFFLPQIEHPGTKSRTTSFVGTAEYVSPEVLPTFPGHLRSDLLAASSDSFYQLIVSKPPFKVVSEREFEFPEDFPPTARDLVDKLLALEADERIVVDVGNAVFVAVLVAVVVVVGVLSAVASA